MALTEKEWVGRPVIPLADGQSALEEVPRLVPSRRAGLRMVERGIRIVEGMPGPWMGEPLLGGIVNNGSLDLPLGLEGNEGVLVAPVVQARNWHLRGEIEQARQRRPVIGNQDVGCDLSCRSEGNAPAVAKANQTSPPTTSLRFRTQVTVRAVSPTASPHGRDPEAAIAWASMSSPSSGVASTPMRQ